MQDTFSSLWFMDLLGISTWSQGSNIVIKPKRKYKLRKVSSEKHSKKLTALQTDVLVGTLLGDATLERRKPSHNALPFRALRFDQTFPNHASYLMMLYGVFHNLTSSGPSVLLRKPDKALKGSTGKSYASLAFKTVTLPCLNEWHSLFYPPPQRGQELKLYQVILQSY